MDFIKQYAKAVVGYVLPILLLMANDLFKGDVPWPQTKEEWLQYVISSLAVGTSVLTVRNTTNDRQVAATQSVSLKVGRHSKPD